MRPSRHPTSNANARLCWFVAFVSNRAAAEAGRRAGEGESTRRRRSTVGALDTSAGVVQYGAGPDLVRLISTSRSRSSIKIARADFSSPIVARTSKLSTDSGHGQRTDRDTMAPASQRPIGGRVHLVMHPELPTGAIRRLTAHYGSCVLPWLGQVGTIVALAAKRWKVELSGYHDAGWTSVVAFGRSDSGRQVFIKASPSAERYEQERAALLHWQEAPVNRLLNFDART